MENNLFLYKDTNLANYSGWINGTSGDTTGSSTFQCFGDTTNNYRSIATDPYGNSAVVWTSFGATSGTSGGIYSIEAPTGVLVDNKKTYRFSIWVRRITEGLYKNNLYYFGYNPRNGSSADYSYAIKEGTTTTSNNYYFIPAASLNTYFPLNEWRFAVGYLMSNDTVLGHLYTDYLSKLYDITGGTLWTNTYNYVMSGTTTGLYMRNFAPYQATSVMESVYPRIDLVDGTEPSIETLLRSEKDNKLMISNVAAQKIITTQGCLCMGLLYNWYAISGSSTNSITSDDAWTVPSKTDWETMRTQIGGSTKGGTLKEVGYRYWDPPTNPDAPLYKPATNIHGFNARGIGGREYDGTFRYIKVSTTFWSTTQFGGGEDQYGAYLEKDDAILTIGGALNWQEGQPVRLVKNTTTLTSGQTGTYTGNDGKVYDTICLGTQEWLSENLRETKYRNGSNIVNITDNTTWDNLRSGAYCAYDNLIDYYSTCCI